MGLFCQIYTYIDKNSIKWYNKDMVEKSGDSKDAQARREFCKAQLPRAKLKATSSIKTFMKLVDMGVSLDKLKTGDAWRSVVNSVSAWMVVYAGAQRKDLHMPQKSEWPTILRREMGLTERFASVSEAAINKAEEKGLVYEANDTGRGKDTVTVDELHRLQDKSAGALGDAMNAL